MKIHQLLPVVLMLSQFSSASPAPAPEGFVEVELWKGTPPGTPAGSLPEEKSTDAAHTSMVSAPRMWLSLPSAAPGAKPAPAVLLLPGGGYGVVGHQYEGTEVAKYLKTRGIASATLIYRCAPQVYPAPLLDARQALAILRQRAAEWNIDPAAIGVMGFSAGGHLAGLLCSGAVTDPPSSTDIRPAFGVLVYPVVRLKGELSHGGSGVNLLGKARVDAEAPALALDRLVDAKWPRTYGLHEEDDPAVPSKGLEALGAALANQGVAHQISIVPGKDHGFGWNRPGADGKPRGPKGWLPVAADWILAPSAK